MSTSTALAARRISLAALRSPSLLSSLAQTARCERCDGVSSATASLPRPQRRTFTTDRLSSSSSPPPPSFSSRLSLTDLLLGFLSGLTLFYGLDWLLYWPEPLPGLQALLDVDPLLQSSVGSPVRVSPLWTGSVREGDSFSVSLPVRGSKGRGRVFARGVYDVSGRQWKLVYLQASVGGLQQRHSLHIPAHMDVRGKASGTVAAAGALVMPANFNPTLLPPEQFVKYQHFLKQHSLQEWKPATSTDMGANKSRELTESSTGTDSGTGTDTQTQPAV